MRGTYPQLDIIRFQKSHSNLPIIIQTNNSAQITVLIIIISNVCTILIMKSIYIIEHYTVPVSLGFTATLQLPNYF